MTGPVIVPEAIALPASVVRECPVVHGGSESNARPSGRVLRLDILSDGLNSRSSGGAGIVTGSPQLLPIPAEIYQLWELFSQPTR